ncbi:MAG: proline--tRNA ligase [Bacilli bacterium]|nr:proline--tRNA ligase [Bacilli bacterium]
MKLKNSYFYTLRENAKDEDSTSGNLLVRSGMIKKVSSGIYMYLPLGLKVLDNIKKIIKEEMDKTGATELLMPSLIPEDIYDVCGRNQALGSSMFHLKDRYNKPYVLGPTHEELFTIAAKSMVRSYKDLPFTIYQDAPKYRDEARPRFGLIRVREFFMKDAYSFDKDEEGLSVSYKKMYDAYKNIFDRIGLNYAIVRADTGVMGGSLSEEFQAITDIGEDVLVLCDKCDYASNMEIATHKIENKEETKKDLELVATPNAKTIDEVCNYLNLDVTKSVKALLMNINDELVAFFIRGDRELNETKVTKLLNCEEVLFASDELISKSNAVPGYTGPINLNGAKIIIDEEVKTMTNFVVGANKEGYHYINANLSDFNYDLCADIVNVKENDICPNCGGKLYFKKGIEVGNTFKLGTKYSEKFGLTYLDENNKSNPVVMGCYGIGPGRILASLVEQNNDEKGIIFPLSVAPFKVCIAALNTKDETCMEVANKLYDELNNAGIDTLLDDRDERPGIKFNDLDLLGIPIRITLGKKLSENKVEFKLRKETESIDLDLNDVVNHIKEYLHEN